MTDVTASPFADALRDRYLIERELGRGGMATVYLAEDLKHDRKVALKVIHPELAATLGPERFQREIRTTARLQHPHILPVLDSGEAGGQLWYTMPFVEGESLRERLRREGEMPIDEALQLLREVVDALAYAHRHGVVHRDIKPDNVLLSGHHAAVTDFGVAKAFSVAGGSSSPTSTGLAVGTPAYMAPEQATADPHVDHRADIYAVGVMAYEMLGGQPPFTGPTPQVVLAAHVTQTPQPLTATRPTVSPRISGLVMRCLEKRPADRWQTAEELLRQLESTTAPSEEGEPMIVAAGRARTSRTSSRQLLLAAVVGVAIALGAAGLIRARHRTSIVLDAHLVAIAPFDVLDPELALWREGMVDVLSRNLDGAGLLRTVAPTTVIRRWSGRADPASGIELGRRTAARYVVLGRLAAEGADTARMAVTVVDAATGRALTEFDRRDAANRMNRLADSASVTILQELSSSANTGGRLTSVGTASLPALKAFLQGEQHYRSGSWDSALVAYERAIRLDSTFALALHRTGNIIGWLRSFIDSSGNAYLLRAGALNRGLSPRDSLLLVQDSLFAAVSDAFYGSGSDTAYWGRLQRLAGTAEDAVRRYPEDRELWEALGEVRQHFGFFIGATLRQVAEPFEHALALDPTFAPQYIHAVENGLRRGGPAVARRYTSAYLRLHPTDENANGIALVDRLLGDSTRRTVATRQMLDTISGDALFQALIPLSYWPDSAETAVMVARLLAAGRKGQSRLASDSLYTNYWLAAELAHRGHLAAAYKTGAPATLDQRLLIELGLLGGVSPGTVDSVLTSNHLSSLGGLVWWAARRDTARISEVLRAADSIRHSHPPHHILIAALGVLGFGPVARGLARQDTAAALTAALSFPDSLCLECWTLRWLRARLLVARGRDQEAFGLLQQYTAYAPTGMEVMLGLERGRVAERLGERESSLESYKLVADTWRNADPELQPYVREAREGIARLMAEPRR